MKSIIGILAVIIAVCCACGSKNKDTDLSPTTNEPQENTTLSYAEEVEKLNNLLQAYDKPMQQFQTTSQKKTTIVGKLGTIVHVDPACLETFDGQPLGETIEVELKEYCNQGELLRGNVATISNGEMIISGGAYYLDMTSDGKPLRIQEGKSINVEFPKFAEEEMELFYGQRDSLGQMNWEAAGQPFRNRPAPAKPSEPEKAPFNEKDIDLLLSIEKVVFKSDFDTSTVEAAGITPQEMEIIKKQRMAELEALRKKREKELALWKRQTELQETMYEAVAISKLGWINCDRFYNVSQTSLLIALNESPDVKVANMYLIFKNTNAVLQSFTINPVTLKRGDYDKMVREFGDSITSTSALFDRIPIGYEVRLISVGVNEKDEMYTYSSDFKIEKNETQRIELKKSSKEELEKLLACKW